jgi:hypothetical protein
MPAVPGPGSLPGTRSRSLALRCYNPTPLTERHTSHDNFGPDGQIRCFHHPPDVTKPPTRENRSRKVNQTDLWPALARFEDSTAVVSLALISALRVFAAALHRL